MRLINMTRKNPDNTLVRVLINPEQIAEVIAHAPADGHEPELYIRLSGMSNWKTYVAVDGEGELLIDGDLAGVGQNALLHSFKEYLQDPGKKESRP